MKVITEIELKDFEFWGGAVYLAKKLTVEEFEIIQQGFEELYPEGITDTMINDIFWFEGEFVAELLGTTEEELEERIDNNYRAINLGNVIVVQLI